MERCRTTVVGLLALLLVACGDGSIVRTVDTAHPPSTSTTTSTTEVRVTAQEVREVPPPPVPTTARPRPTATPGPRPVISGDSWMGWPCGGNLPPCWVARHEGARGDPRAVNRTGCGGRTCGGLWQFDPVTFSPDCTVSRFNGNGPPCALYRGFRFAQDAPGAVQNDRAEELWDQGRGCSHWAAC